MVVDVAPDHDVANHDVSLGNFVQHLAAGGVGAHQLELLQCVDAGELVQGEDDGIGSVGGGSFGFSFTKNVC